MGDRLVWWNRIIWIEENQGWIKIKEAKLHSALIWQNKLPVQTPDMVLW